MVALHFVTMGTLPNRCFLDGSWGLPALAIEVGMGTDFGWFAENCTKVRKGISAAVKEISTKGLTALIEYHVTAWLHREKTGITSSPQVSIGIDEVPSWDALPARQSQSISHLSPRNHANQSRIRTRTTRKSR